MLIRFCLRLQNNRKNQREGCKVPDSWKLYYQDEAGNWKEVPGADAYPCKRGVACIVNFDPVKTKAMKLELKQPETHSCGLFEWSVK